MGLIDRWIEAERSRPPATGRRKKRPLSESQEALYRQHWRQWVDWLATPGGAGAGLRPVAWHEATPAHVRDFFLNGRSERSPANRQVATLAFKESTQRRYLLLLRRIYAHDRASRDGAGSNPAAEDLQTKPEVTAPTVVSAAVLARLVDAVPLSDHWRSLRDRALVAIAADAALTPRELASLPRSAFQARTAAGRYVFRLPARGKAPARELMLGRRASRAVELWLAVRDRQLVPKAASARALLFVSLQGKALSRMQVYSLLHAALSAAYKAEHGAPDNDSRVSLGPMTVRNSRLRLRLEAGEDPQMVALDAGLTDLRSLQRLLHPAGGSATAGAADAALSQ